jgi:hypothetical protein
MAEGLDHGALYPDRIQDAMLRFGLGREWNISDRAGENGSGLSQSIAVYRSQAESNDGILDGKLISTGQKTSAVQKVISARDDRVGVRGSGAKCGMGGQYGEAGDCGQNWQFP